MGSSRPDLQSQVSMLRSPACAFFALALITVILYHDTVFRLVQQWTHHQDPTYQHGLLLVGISAFLFCRRWAEVKKSVAVRPSLSAAALLLLTSCAWLLADLAHVVIVEELSLVLLLGLLVVSAVGYRSGRLLLFPVVLLIFAVPSIWEPLRPMMQRLTAHAASFLVNLTPIPALLEGTQISVPAGTFEVAPFCSGLVNLIVGTLAGALFAYINRLRFRAAIWTLVGAVGVSFLANALRIGAIVVTGELTGMQHYFVMTDHGALGWAFFGACIMVFLVVASRLIGPTERAPSRMGRQMEALPVSATSNASLAHSVLLSLGALVFGPALAYASQSDRSVSAELTLDLPAQIRGWQGGSAPHGGYRPGFGTPDFEYETFYHDTEGRRVYLYVGEFAYQEQGKEAVSNANKVYDGLTWQPMLTRTRHLADSSTVRETWLRSRTGTEKLVWQWYYVHGVAVSSPYMAKLVTAWSTLNKDPAAAVVVVATDFEGNAEGAEALLLRFVADTKHTVEAAIDRTRLRSATRT